MAEASELAASKLTWTSADVLKRSDRRQEGVQRSEKKNKKIPRGY